MSLGSAISRVKEFRGSTQTYHQFLTEALNEVREKPISEDMWIGASRLPELCPRAYTIAYRLGVPFIDSFDANSKWNMDMGTGIHTVFQDMWAGPNGILVGGWECPRCHHLHGEATVGGGVLYPESCDDCGHRDNGYRTGFFYKEPYLQDDELRIRGFIDGVGQLPSQPAEIFDVKSTGSIRYVKKVPRENDVKQLNILMDMAGMKRGRLIYIDRTAKKFSSAFVEHQVFIDYEIVNAMKDTVRALREALKAPKSEPSLPACPNGGVGTFGPCQCKGVESAWEAHGPRSGASTHGHLHPE